MERGANRGAEHNWTTFGACFVGLFPFVPHKAAPADSVWELGNTVDQSVENFKNAEAPFVSQIESVIRNVFEKDCGAPPSKSVEYFIGCRGDVLSSLLTLFSAGNGVAHETIIPFPELPTLRVAQWFLIDWWRTWGPLSIAQARHLTAIDGMD